MLWNAHHLHKLGYVTHSWNVDNVTIDSRDVFPKSLFIALQGMHHDGHNFLSQAFEKGAAAAIVSEQYWKRNAPSFPLLVVKDTKSALWELGKLARARYQGTCVAITGSVGKTSIKEALAVLLRPYGEVYASKKSHNNAYGVPLTLSNLFPQVPFAILEVGTSAPGEIATLGGLVRPKVAVITNIGHTHTQTLGTLDQVALEKSSLLDHVLPGGFAILPLDSAFYPLLAGRAQRRGLSILTFGMHTQADIRIHKVEPLQAGGSLIELLLFQKFPLRFLLGMPPFWTCNSAAIIGAFLGLDCLGALEGSCALSHQKEAGKAALHTKLTLPSFLGFLQPFLDGLRTLNPLRGRGAIVRTKWPYHPSFPLAHDEKEASITFIDDSYNASPLSMQAALSTLQAYTKGKRKIAILGDMQELGPYSAAMHRSLLQGVGFLDMLITCGPCMQQAAQECKLSTPWHPFLHAEEIVPFLASILQEGDVVLVKGSHSVGLHRIVYPVL